MKKILFGIKPTGILHLGHIKTILEFKTTALFLIADEHAVVSCVEQRNNIRFLTNNLIVQLLSIGVPIKNIYVQSDLQFNTQLMFYMTCFSNTSFLNRMHLNKTQSETLISEWLYPVLMANDIIASNCTHVLAGEDQRQHIELCNDLISKIRAKMSDFHFYIQYILYETVVGIDGRKMSKSYKNTISPFDSIETLDSQIKKIKTSDITTTDSVLFQLQTLLVSAAEASVIAQRYADGTNYSTEKQFFFNFMSNWHDEIQKNEKKFNARFNVIRHQITKNCFPIKRNLKSKLKQFKRYFKIQ